MTAYPSGSPKPSALVDVTDGDQVLDFAYGYLRKLRRAPTDAAVREITGVIARCNAGLISYTILECVVDRAMNTRPRPPEVANK
jgi:hypothetical protein